MLDFSQITRDLFIGVTPQSADYSLLWENGVRLIINMRFGQSPYPHPDPGSMPIDILWMRTFDNPFLPIPQKYLLTGTHKALETISKGGKVYSHCAKGRHRSVAMGASILIAQGDSAKDAMAVIKQQRPISDPYIFYIKARIQQFERLWKHHAHASLPKINL